jgi:U4/U6.U5 tri-snRNP component SNU23
MDTVRRKFSTNGGRKGTQSSTQVGSQPGTGTMQRIEEITNSSVGNVGKTSITHKGFYCEFCNQEYKDNLSYLEHLASIQHLKNTGKSMRIERSTLEKVKNRMKQRLERKAAAAIPKTIGTLTEENEKLKKKTKKEEAAPVLDSSQMEILSMMGIAQFGSSKAQ